MTNRNVILGLIERKHPESLCDDSISAATGIMPRQQVNQICRRLRDQRIIDRTRCCCADCGGFKLCNVLDGAPPSPPLPPQPPSLQDMRNHIVRFCRGLAERALPTASRQGCTPLIRRLRDAKVLPAHQAEMMLIICHIRDKNTYEELRLGEAELAVIQGAWAIVESWAMENHADLWRAAAR